MISHPLPTAYFVGINYDCKTGDCGLKLVAGVKNGFVECVEYPVPVPMNE